MSVADGLCFLIIAHRDPVHLRRLVCRLQPYPVFVHIDGKCDIEPFREVLANCKHCTVLEKRVRVEWAGYSMVEATLLLIEAARSEGVFDSCSRVLLLSGADYLIRPLPELVEYLRRLGSNEMIRVSPILKTDRHQMARLQRLHVRDAFSLLKNRFLDRVLRKLIRTVLFFPRRRVLSGYRFAYGSSWWALTPGALEAVVEFVKARPDFVRFMKKTHASDETVFHTALLHTEYADKVLGPDISVGEDYLPEANLHIVFRDFRRTYWKDGFERLVESDKFFVRKVDSVISADLLDRIDRELLQKPLDE